MARLGSGIPLQARTAEIGRLRAAFDRAAESAAGAVLLAGDAGVGKSRLLQELARYARDRDAVVLIGHCLEAGDVALPYLPFAEAFGALDERYRPMLVERPALAALLGEGFGAERRRSEPAEQERIEAPYRLLRSGDEGQLRLFDAAWGLLRDLAGQRCVVLVVEDLHWADDSSRHLLRFLVSRMKGYRLLLVASYRGDDLHRRHPLRPMLAELGRQDPVERIDLEPLRQRETEQLVTALAERPLDQAVIARVAERSEGNPFFAEELLASCLDCDPERDTELPPALADVLLARIEARGSLTRRVIKLASVGGRRVRHSRLQVVASESMTPEDLDTGLREAVTHHLLVVNGDEYSFRHALLREAVYDDLLPGERTRIHERYAACIAAGPASGTAGALAYHSRAAGNLPGALAASVTASREAARLGAPAEALRHAESALELWAMVDGDRRPEDAEELVLLRNASTLAQRAGEPERSVSYARAAVERADVDGDPERSAHARWRLAQALFTLEDPDGDAGEIIERAWELVAELRPGRTKVWVAAVNANRLRTTDRSRARALAEQARREARELGLGGPEAEALTTLALIDDREGDPDSALRHMRAAVTRASRSDSRNAELRARYFLALRHYEHGDLAEAAGVVDEVSSRAAETGMTWSTFGVECRVLQVLVRFVLGEWDAADEAGARPGGRVSDTVRMRVSAAHLNVLVARGDFDEAQRVHDWLAPEWSRDTQIGLFSGLCGIELACWQGQYDSALERAAELELWCARNRISKHFSMIRLAALALRARAGIGPGTDDAEADRLRELAGRIAASGTARTGTPGPEAMAWLALARAEHGRAVGRPDPGAWTAAVTAFGYGDEYRQSVARLRYAETLLAAAERDRATAELSEALLVARGLGAAPLESAIIALARRGRVTLDGLRTGVPDLLTDRELSVLELVAHGQTNRQVGASLYISEKTVSVHLSRAMSKLGVSRRAEAVAAAYDRGLL